MVDAADEDAIVVVDGSVVTTNVVEKSVVIVVEFVKFVESIGVVEIVRKGIVDVDICVFKADVVDGFSILVVLAVLFVDTYGSVLETEKIVLVEAIDVVEAIVLEFIVVDSSVINWVVVILTNWKLVVVEKEFVEVTAEGRLDVELIRGEDKTVVVSIEVDDTVDVEAFVVVEAGDEEV